MIKDLVVNLVQIPRKQVMMDVGVANFSILLMVCCYHAIGEPLWEEIDNWIYLMLLSQCFKGRLVGCIGSLRLHIP